MTNAELVKKYQKMSIRYWRMERYVLSSDNQEIIDRWYKIRRERNDRFRFIQRELLNRGVEPNFIPIFE